MYTWRFFLAIVFLLLWYFSELGQLWIQVLFCFICFFSFPLKKHDRERSTQTDDAPEEAAQQTRIPSVSTIDEIDAAQHVQTAPEEIQYPNVHRSLLQVFKCAYAHLFQPWYNEFPETVDKQPLHRALQKEFNLIVEKVICKAKHFDLTTTSVGCVRILTQHLHNAKQSEGSPVFGSRSGEMAALRNFSEALVRNFIPEHLCGVELFQCVLTEVVAIKALDVLVTSLCTPNNLNKLVVLQLDRVTNKSSTGDLLHSDREGTPSSMESEEAELLTDEGEDGKSEQNKAKKKGNKLKEQFSKLFNKVKKGKKKKQKSELRQKALSSRRSAIIEGNGASSREGSIGSVLDSDYDSEMDVYPTTVQEDRMEFKLSYEMWRVGNWRVCVTSVDKENEELSFTVHLEERNNPENFHWDVKKTQSELLHFHDHCQDTSNLPSISAIIVQPEKELDVSSTEVVRSALEHFLQKLVSDPQLGHTQSVFQFLCPLAQLLNDKDHDGGVWRILNGIASFLTPGQDEEESHILKGEDQPDGSGAAVHQSGPQAQQTSVDTDEESKEKNGEGAFSSDEYIDKFKSKEPNVVDLDQASDELDGVSDGQDSLAESIGSFVNRSKLVFPSAFSNDLSSSVTSLNDGVEADCIDACANFPSWGKTLKKEKLTNKKLNGSQIFKMKEKVGQGNEEKNRPQALKKENSNNNLEQVEATKALFDLFKEITGNSFIFNIIDAILKPVQPLLKKKINGFLKRMHPTESQIASYIDHFKGMLWPEGNVPLQSQPEKEDKKDMKEKALQLLNSKYANSLILKKSDVETVFKIFQDAEENKKLVYMLLSYILREFLPGEPAFSAVFNQTVKDLFL